MLGIRDLFVMLPLEWHSVPVLQFTFHSLEEGKKTPRVLELTFADLEKIS